MKNWEKSAYIKFVLQEKHSLNMKKGDKTIK